MMQKTPMSNRVEHLSPGGGLARRALVALLAVLLVAVVYVPPAHAGSSESSLARPVIASVTAGDGQATIGWTRAGSYNYVAMVFPADPDDRPAGFYAQDSWCYVADNETADSCTVDGLTNDEEYSVYLWVTSQSESGVNVDHLAIAFMNGTDPLTQPDYWRGSCGLETVTPVASSMAIGGESPLPVGHSTAVQQQLADAEAQLPVGPTDLQTTITDDGNVVLSWTAAEDFQYLYEYEIIRERAESDGVGRGRPVVHAYTGSLATTWTDDDAEPGELYSYQVRAASYFNRISQRTEAALVQLPVPGEEGTVNEVIIFDPPPVSPPATGNAQQAPPIATSTEPPSAPTNLTATVNDDGHIVLSWDAPPDADAVTGYQIVRRRPRHGENTLMVYVDDTGSADATYTDTEAPAGTLYVYRVKAHNSAGTSARSNYVNVDHTP